MLHCETGPLKLSTTMKLSDSGTLHAHQLGDSPSESGMTPPCDCPALPTSEDLRHLLAVAHEQGLLASETLFALLAALEQRDAATARHAYRTAGWCVWLATMAQTPT